MRGQPKHSTRPHGRLVPSFLGMGAWMTSHVTTERSFDSETTWVVDVLGVFFDVLYMYTNVCKNKALVDVCSTVVGMKCLYCICCPRAF